MNTPDLLREVDRRLAEIETRVKKGTHGTWYAHPYEKQVRTSFMRWLQVTEVEPQYQKHVANMEDETWAIATALNEVQWLTQQVRTSLELEAKLVRALERINEIQWSERSLETERVAVNEVAKKMIAEYRAVRG